MFQIRPAYRNKYTPLGGIRAGVHEDEFQPSPQGRQWLFPIHILLFERKAVRVRNYPALRYFIAQRPMAWVGRMVCNNLSVKVSVEYLDMAEA